MKRIAVVTTESRVPSPIGARAHELLRYLDTHVEVTAFVDGSDQASNLGDGKPLDAGGRDARDVSELAPRDHDQIVYFVGNEAAHAFMLPWIRRVGGTVVLFDWELGELARAARPALASGGVAGRVAAWREGGWGAFRAIGRGGVREAARTHAFNRSVVRCGDSFIVADPETRRRLLEERNAATPIAVLPWVAEAGADDLESVAARFAECIDWMPPHRTNRKSLIRTAIEASDQAREDSKE